MNAAETEALQLALTLAENAIGLSDPNPRVGCVLLSAQGAVIASGHTQRAGQGHAEVMALAEARRNGAATQGSTAVVTLEPCSHFCRTPPCCDALIEAGVARVVVANQDPNPLVSGQGLARLRAAGIDVALADAAWSERAAELNLGFFQRMRTGKPFVRLKVAVSLDGRTALPNGASQWITGVAARRDGHAFRRRAGVVLTGIGTVLADDPRLDVREVPTVLQPLRVVVDAGLRIRPDARVLRPPGDALLAHAHPSPPPHLAPFDKLYLPGKEGRVDLPQLLETLGQRGINEVHVEAGPRLSGAFLAGRLVDELLVYQAPILLGDGLPLAALPGLDALDQASRWQRVDCTPLDADLRLRFRPL